jgi:hypothetical protein
MQCKGIVQGNVVILEEGIYLPDDMRVTVTVEQEEQQEPAEATDEELAQRRALGKPMPSLVVDAIVTIKWLNMRRL